MNTYNIVMRDFRNPGLYGFISDTMYIFDTAVDASDFNDDERRNLLSNAAMLTSGKV